MMGMVFTELLDMVESTFSFDTVDAVIARSGTRGTYTSVGNYDDAELFAIVEALSAETGIPTPELLHAYGRHLFHRFYTMYPSFFDIHANAPDFLAGLETHVHTEVRKLYPVARPPLFTLEATANGAYFLEYRSQRGLWKFAHGLLDACFLHYGGAHRVADIVDQSGGEGTWVRFEILPA
jgi:hypothetical protein